MFNNTATATMGNGLSNNIILSGITTENIVGIDPSYYPNITTTTTTGNSTFTINYSRCRECYHAHLNDQCIEFTLTWGSVSFVNCQCEEYIPEDNLEYLEYLYDKKRKSTPSL